MGLEEEEKVNRLSQTILKVMRLEVLLAIGLIIWVTSMSGCSSVNHLDAAVFGYKYVDKRVIAEETYEVFQSEKQSDFFRAAVVQEGFCCSANPRRWVNNVTAIEGITQCKVDPNFVRHAGLMTEARVACPVE